MNRKNLLIITLLILGCNFIANGQATICPPNIDFETGTYADWTYYNGTVATGLTAPIYTLPLSVPIIPRREMLTSGPGLDYYGHFPIVAPGAGNYSLRLGSDTNHLVAERATYYVDIPAGTTVYSLVYHYAAVLENPTGHTPEQMPRFVVSAYDSLSGDTIPCAVYTYVSGGAVPGFFPSTVNSTIAGNGPDVTYKPWTFGNIKFPGENGRTVAIEFTANACTLGQHFGYGYLDMTCGLFANVISCSTVTDTLTAPNGFSSYQWLDSTTMTTSYGTTQSIVVAAPTVPTTYAVIITPYAGYGCPDTLYSRLIPTHLAISPSDDTTICSGNNVILNPNATDIATPLTYSWAPSAGLSCTACATPTATPATTTAYTVTITDPGGCSLSHIFNITVFPSPTAISGSLNACLGYPVTLSDGTGGGVWASGNTAAATVDSVSGQVTGLTLDTATITYSFGAGLCIASSVVTVNPLPLPIGGVTPVCAGSTITLTDATTGGTWSSASAGMATVGSSSGVVTGINIIGGNVTVTYTSSVGCPVTALMTVNPLSPITGVTHVCTGLTTALNDATAGGTWLSGNNSIATVDATGLVTGVAAAGGVDTITYTTPAGCTATTAVTVNPLPAIITGGMSICPGTTTTLHDATSGGTWASGSIPTATILPSGVVTGAAAGTDTITYTLPTGCLISAAVTVNPTPPVITGITSVCTGSATLLSDGITGGTWSSGATTVATAGSSSGVVGGVSAAGGTATITYTSPAGCKITTSVVVNPLPSAITGTEVVCSGQSTTLHDASSGGTWSSGNTAVATVPIATSGTINSISPGTSTITYTLPTGCSVTAVLTVNLTPLPISGAGGCIGSTTSLTDATTGGTWSSGNTAIATIGSITGIIGGVSATGGTVVITYAMPTGCMVTATETLNPLPIIFTVTGGGAYCVGSPAPHVFLSGSTAGVIYQLYNSGTTVGAPFAGTGSSIDFGPETAAGTYTVAATNSTTGCTNPMAGSVTVTVNPVPPLFTVTGGGSYCAGGTGFHVGLSGSTVGINYQAHNGLFVSPIRAGTGSSLDFGVETVGGTYTVIATNPATGCTSTMTGSAVITVLPLPSLFSVTGGGGYCAGGTGVPVGLSGSTVGITYELFNGVTGIAVLAGSGSAISFGLQPAAGTYTILGFNSATSCTATMTGSATIIINPLPAAITGPATVCVGATITEADDSLGGTWSSSIPGNASINSSSGVVTGGTSSTSTLITYTLSTGCTATRTINVSLSPGPISGPSAVCVGSAITETDPVTPGVWSSGASTIATVNSSGMVTGELQGTASIIYTLPSTSCFISVPVTVNPLPGTITGVATVCTGLTTTLNDASTGGTWSCGTYTSVATVTSAGVITGVSGGTALVTYTLPTSCLTTTTVTVYPSPAAIFGPASVCQNATISLSDAVTGGAWSSGNTAAATIGVSSGTVYPVAPGTAVVTYTLPGSCTITKSIVVNPIAPITGVGVVCQGSTVTLNDATPGGTWSSSATGIATVAGGVVGGVTPGVATIIYTTPAGCTTTFNVIVNITPTAVSGVASVCVASSTSLGDGVPAGAWSSSNTGVATVTSLGVVWGAVAGTSTITYALPTGCSASIVATVNPLPAAITGVATVCDGLTTTLFDGTTGGSWSSSSTLLATVNASTGVVGGEAPSTVTITYTISLTGCKASTLITVNPLPAALTGPASICVGYTTALSETTTGGAWSSSITSVATVGPEIAVDTIYGVSPGTSIIAYTLPTGCTATQMVTVVPVPTEIVGPPMVCEGQFISLTVPGAPGGTWATGPASLATIGLTNGLLTGVASGTVIVSYTIGIGCDVIGSRIVNALSPISGDSVLCVGQAVTLTDTTQDGAWSSINPTVATAITTGLSTGSVTATGAGTANIEYTLPTGCIATYIITVNPSPAGITGVTAVCVDNTTTLNDASAPGTWSSGNTGFATVYPSGGVVTGISPGPVTIYYTLTSTGCSTSTTVTVNALPTPITGPSFVCPGFTVDLTDFGSGTWSSSSTTVATIGATSGMLTGLEPGGTSISYTLPVTGCSTSIAFTVEPLPDPVGGTAVACLGSTTYLTETTLGGVWTSGNAYVAPVDLFSGVVTGSELGTATITFTTSFGCTTTRVVTVDPAPAAITGTGAVCPGGTLTLYDATTGGTWSSSPAYVASVTSEGVVTGAAAGTATIYYTLGGYCAATAIVTVNPLPGTITGALHVCSVGVGFLIDAATGGLWSSSNTGVGTIVPTSGFMTGVSPGTTTVTYTLPTTCAITEVVTVDVMPLAIEGPNHVCISSTITLNDTVGGGVWSSSLPGIATVGTATGVVSGATPGATVATYAIGACNVNTTINVYALPGIDTVTGGGPYCSGGSGVTIGLTGSSVGILYYLYRGVTATGTFSGTGSGLDFGLQTVTGTYTVIAVATATGCSSLMDGSALVTAIPTITPSVTMTETPATTICAGTTVTFDPVPVSGGPTPGYEWKVNGVEVATTANYNFIPANGDVVTVEMTSDTLCPAPAVVSYSVTMTVHIPGLPAVGIASSPGDTVCNGSPVTLTAIPTFGGASPAFVWTKNGAAAGTDPILYYIPSNGDVLYCTMTSNYLCRLADVAISDTVTITVDTPVTPVVTITANPGTEITIGMFDTLTATVADGGPSPTFQWYLNGYPVAGATSNTYMSNSYTYPKEDSVSCEITADNPCHMTSFQWVYINAGLLGVKPVLSGNSDIAVIPNPNKGTFTVKGSLGTTNDEEVQLEITDMLGQVVYNSSIVAHNGTINERVSLPNTVANGMYLLNLHTETGNEVFHIVVEQ